MWNKRRDEEPPLRPSSPSNPPEFVREPVNAPTPSFTPKQVETEAPRGVATIGKSVSLKGQIFSREDLYLDGELEGTVEVPEHRLTIGAHGRLQASIKAREIVVLGAVNGNVEASEKIDIRKDARLVGDIRTGRITIEDGAYFKGSIDIVRQEAAKPAPAPKQQAPSSPVNAPPVGTVAGDQKR